MAQRIDQFRDDLNAKLTNVESSLDALKTKIDARTAVAETEVRNHLDKVNARIAQGGEKVKAAQTQINKWAEAQKAATAAKIADWKARRETAKLQDRADFAEDYAAAAIDVAIAAIDEAEQASLEAWLARYDADVALAK